MNLKTVTASAVGVALCLAGSWAGARWINASQAPDSPPIESASPQAPAPDAGTPAFRAEKRLGGKAARARRDLRAPDMRRLKKRRPERGQSGEDPKAIYRVPVGDSPAKGPATAKVTLVEISDFECHYCAQANDTVEALLRLYPEDVRVVMKQNPLNFHPNAHRAAQAALAAHAQGKYWEMHARLFEKTKQKKPLDEAALAQCAEELGLDVARFKEEMASAKHAARVDADRKMAIGIGARATPTFFVNGRKLVGTKPLEAFRKIIEEERAKADALLAKGVAPEALYDAITEGGATRLVLLPGASEPSNPFLGTGPAKEVAIAGHNPVKGAPNARVTLVGFMDFECPYCATTSKDLTTLVGQYPGDVKVVFRNLPLDFHPNARAAALAAMAAQRQGKFWQMHDALFANHAALSAEAIEAQAKKLGLDLARFESDRADLEVTNQVREDIAEAKKLGIMTTPTLFVNGRMLIGAQPLSSIRDLVEEELAKTKP